MKKFDIIAIGELNVDLILNHIQSMLVIGKEIFADDMLLTLGSSTAIFAANAASLGMKVAFVGMIGKDNFGELVKTSLEKRSVSTRYLIETDQYATGATIVLAYAEDRANITYQGSMDTMGFNDIDPSVFEITKHIHISSIFIQSGLKRDLLRILKLAKERGITVSLDTQWDPMEKWDLDYTEILPYVTLFMPNETELKGLAGTSDLHEAIEKIRPYIGEACIVKCGSQGSILFQKDGTTLEASPFLNTEVIDTIGAGDSFNAGFVYSYVKGYSLAECQRLGNLTGAINTTAAGGIGAFTDKNEIEKRALEIFGQTIQL